MPTPIFQRQETQLNGVFATDRARLQFPDSPGLNGVLVQGMSFTYAQQVTRLYEVGAQTGSNLINVYYVGGRTQGNAQLNRVVGPHATIIALYEEFGNVCNACENDLELELEETDCCFGTEQNLAYILKFCVLTQVGVSVQAQDMIINETSQIMFSGLNYDGGRPSNLPQSGGSTLTEETILAGP